MFIARRAVDDRSRRAGFGPRMRRGMVQRAAALASLVSCHWIGVERQWL